MPIKSFLVFAVLVLLLPSAAMAKMKLPVDGVVTSGVGWRPDPFGSGKLTYHRGIDIAVPVGTPVRATEKGKVVFSGDRRGYGATVILEHENGDRTLYGHNAAVRVRVGDVVETGTVVAVSGNSGRSTGPHVHYELIAATPAPAGKQGAETETVEVARTGVSKGDDRHLLERRMQESLDSLLKNIRSDITGG